MKELIKPNDIEKSYAEVESLNEGCGTYCEPPETCNRHCTGQGTTNKAPLDDIDILF